MPAAAPGDAGAAGDAAVIDVLAEWCRRALAEGGSDVSTQSGKNTV